MNSKIERALAWLCPCRHGQGQVLRLGDLQKHKSAPETWSWVAIFPLATGKLQELGGHII